jgi:hypothetical protein
MAAPVSFASPAYLPRHEPRASPDERRHQRSVIGVLDSRFEVGKSDVCCWILHPMNAVTCTCFVD